MNKQITDPMLDKFNSDLLYELKISGNLMKLRFGSYGKRGFRITYKNNVSKKDIFKILFKHGIKVLNYDEHVVKGKNSYINIHKIEIET